MTLSKMKLAHSCAISLSSEPAYVLNFAFQEYNAGGRVAIAVSCTHEIKLYNLETFCTEGVLSGHTSTISCVAFDVKNPKIVWSASLDGTLRSWDISNAEKKSSIISNLSIGYSALGLSCDGALLVAGTEKDEESEEVMVEVWDIRNPEERSPKKLAVFKDIHSDDITKVLFHPSNPKVVGIGSTDGLVNILDLTTYDEDDSLTQTLNTELSVCTFGFFGTASEFMFVLTDMETLQIWNYMEAKLMVSCDDLLKKAKSINYIIDCFYHELSQRLFLVGGTKSGDIEIFHVNVDVIEPFQVLQGGHSSIIRCFVYAKQYFLTGAEDGMMCAWRPMNETPSSKITLKNLKIKSKKKKKPYNV
ncbi:WD repeat-containing protein 89-like [Hydra vulgaris]|uniref:WD repeat-containing protein 89 n=1 Tax=Hydra vulgaris TaxID=6087 RepID=A0ABM4DQE7_HYDVU